MKRHQIHTVLFISIIFGVIILAPGHAFATPTITPTVPEKQDAHKYRLRGATRLSSQVVGRDTMTVVEIAPLYIFKRPIDTRKYARLIYNLKVVYPIAQDAKRTLAIVENHLLSLKTKREQDQYIKTVEKILKENYTPVLKKMTFSQGKILIKLIDRETDKTSYDLVKQLRGNFSAFLWQGVARIFGANLKDKYDKEGEDKIIEQIIVLYEAGLL